MDSTKIDRINTLHHKAQSVGLTEEEKKEQAELRKEHRRKQKKQAGKGHRQEKVQPEETKETT